MNSWSGDPLIAILLVVLAVVGIKILGDREGLVK